MPDANSHEITPEELNSEGEKLFTPEENAYAENYLDGMLDRARLNCGNERVSGSPAYQTPMTDGPVIMPVRYENIVGPKALVNVETFNGNDEEVDQGTIKIPLAAFEAAKEAATCTTSWEEDSFTINFGGIEGLSIHICPESE